MIVRFAFYSDPGFSTFDDASITGFQVDNIVVSGGVFSDDADGDELMTASGAVWVDQFYDYWDDGTSYDPRPGSNGWEEYMQGYPFNGNVFLDISDFQGKDVMFRFQSRHDENQDGGAGQGLYIDDFRVYKISGGNYPSPTGLVAESGDGEVMLSWNDMNFAGIVDYVYDNDVFDEYGGITRLIQLPQLGLVLEWMWLGHQKFKLYLFLTLMSQELKSKSGFLVHLEHCSLQSAILSQSH